MENSRTKKNLFKPAEPSVGLFDRIIEAIKLEELRHAKRLLYAFTALFLASLVLLPFSFFYLMHQWAGSGVTYFISTAMLNANAFLSLWRDFALSIFESLPIMAIVFFSLNVALVLFSVRLFFYKNGTLFQYFNFKHHIA